MSQLTCFDLEIEDRIAHLVLCRPDKFNSMSPEFWSELPEIVRSLDRSGEARAIVLSSTGKHFTSGMDLTAFAGGGTQGPRDDAKFSRARANFRRSILEFQESFSCLEQARIPVLAAIQGGCIGGGVDLVSACDIRYATEDAFFCIQEINIGITADVGTLQRLPRLIPEGMIRELAYTGRRLPAKKALEIGLVNEIYPDQKALLEGVMQVAREIAERSPLAVWGSKEMINYARDHTVADGLNYVATWQTGMFQPSEVMESVKAKSEKRKPDYADLLPLKSPI